MNRHSQIIFLVFLLGSFCAMGQGTISGKSTVTAGTSSTYTLVDDVIYASPNWQTTSGYVSSSSRTGVGPFTYRATIVFDGPSGVNTISFFTGSTLLSTMNVTVNCPAVGLPNAVFGFTYGCGSTTVTTATTPPSGETWYWQSSPSGTNTSTASNVGYSLSSGGTYYLRSKNSSVNCWGTAQSFTVTVNPFPGAPAASGATVCSSGFLTATPGANANSVNWYTTPTGGTPTTGLNSPAVTTTTTFYITSLNTGTGCQTATRTTVTIGVNPQPSVPIFGTSGICVSGSGTAGPGANGNQVRWYTAPSGGSPVSSTNSSPAISASTTFYLSTYNTSTTCESVRTAFTVIVDPVPAVTVNGSGTLTYGGGTVLSTYAGAYAYQWKLNGNNILGGNLQSYSPTLAGNFTVGVKKTVSSAECPSGAVNIATGAQPTPINLVSVTSIMKEGVAANTSLYNLTQQDLAQSIAYQDGIGRTFQSVGVGLSPNQTDMVMVASFGRNGLADTVAFLPYATATKDGRFKPNALRTSSNQYTGSDQYQFYQTAPKVAQDAQPFARVVRKASPDARVLEQGAPGADWQPGAGHMVKNTVALNNTTYNPRYWKTDGTTTSYYPSGQVAVAIATDENGNQVRTYTNALGQTILKQVQEGVSNWLETYYVYDQYGRLKYQVPPKAVQAIGSNTVWSLVSNTTTDELVFKYSYDSLGRIKEKKVPGSGAEYVVYDPLGRAVLTQDANLRAAGQWRFVKYDLYGRVAYTGLYTTASSRKTLQDQFNGLDYTLQPYYENLAAGGPMQGYTNTTFPTANLTVLSASYYDTYDFDNNGTDDFTYQPAHLAGLPTTPSVASALRGLPTGGTRLVLGTTTWLRSAIFYDEYDRAVQTQSYNHLNTATPDISSIAYADLVHVANTKLTHNGPTVVTVEQRYVYDPNWRTTEIWHRTNGGTEYKVAGYTYNALGQLVDKQLHVMAGVPLQSVDYRYHIRGWLKSINNAQLANDGNATNDDTNDYFGMEFTYNAIESGLGNTQYFNGNLSVAKWKGPGLASGNTDQRSYKYTYDKSERLLTSTFAAHNGSTWAKEANTLNETFAFDANGNLSTLVRNQNQRGLSGTTVTSTPQTVDNLTYTYTANTNSMAKVEDAVAATTGTGDFKNNANNAVEYTYTADGSMAKDDNKGIASITYNILGKPQVVTYSGTPTKTVTYTYDAVGAKLKTVTLANSVTTTTDYIGGFVYTNNSLSFFSSPEGRVVKNGSNYEYQYSIADHQGNTRVLFSSAAPTPTTLNATFEGDANDNSNLYSNVNPGFVVPYGSANNTAGGVKVVRLNQTYSAGPAKSLKVYPGDKVDMETYCYYEGSSGFGSGNQTVASMVASIASAFGGVSGGAGESGLIYNGVNSALTGFGLGPNLGDGRPSAYLNYILFDQQYRVVDMGWQPVPISANFAKQKITMPQITVKEAGYVFVYLSYETASNNWVYFDDFKITQTKTNVVQYNEYYAHGLQTANSWTRENTTGNNYLGNGGTELNTTTSLYELDFRNFDPQLGRMAQVDPMADKYGSLTPYNYSYNMPNMVVDTNGADPADNGGRDPANYWFEESMQRRAARDRGTAIDFPVGNQFSKMFRQFGVSLMEQRAIGGGGAGITNPGIFSDAAWAQIGGTVNEMFFNTNSFDGKSVWFNGEKPVYYDGNGRGQLYLREREGYELIPEYTSNYKDYNGVKGPAYNFRLTGFVWMAKPQLTQGGAPTIFINLEVIPKGFDQAGYINDLRTTLIANGFASNLVVEYSSLGGRLKAWWNDSPTGTVTIKNFRLGKDRLEAGGYSPLNDPNRIIVYNGLSPTGAGKQLPMWAYVNAAVHEIGHGFFGFSHAFGTGATNDPTSIMDYRSAYRQGAGFNAAQQAIIKASIWGGK